MSIETTSQKITLQNLLFRYLPILNWLPHYAIFGTSKQVVVYATSASAALLASTIVALNPTTASMYYTFAEVLVLLVGVVFLLAGLFKLGFITNFLSRPLMDGFIFGLAIFIAA